jgi:hypothetical protein
LKYERVSRSTIPERRSRPIRFGSAIRPFATSEKRKTPSRVSVDPI